MPASSVRTKRLGWGVRRCVADCTIVASCSEIIESTSKKVNAYTRCLGACGAVIPDAGRDGPGVQDSGAKDAPRPDTLGPFELALNLPGEPFLAPPFGLARTSEWVFSTTLSEAELAAGLWLELEIDHAADTVVGRYSLDGLSWVTPVAPVGNADGDQGLVFGTLIPEPAVGWLLVVASAVIRRWARKERTWLGSC